MKDKAFLFKVECYMLQVETGKVIGHKSVVRG